MGLLRFITYLSPALPEELFARLARQVGERLGAATSLAVELRSSGPHEDAIDPFTAGEADVGFLCAPPFLWLRDRTPPALELAGAGWVFDEPRAAGAPVYFSDVIVAAASPARRFADLRGGIWAYNDVCSLSGFHCLLRRLDRHGGASFFRELRPSGAHHTSLDWVARGIATAAAIDSNGLRLQLVREPALRERIRILETWGPHPIQPIALRASLPAELRAELTCTLLAIGSDPAALAELAPFGVRALVPVDESLYPAERAALHARAGYPAHPRDSAAGVDA